jgi:membrane fusion protein (multidrug efflux system)
MNEMSRVTGEDVGDGEARSRLGRWRPVLLWSVPVILFAVGVWFWLTSGRTVETDNATVEAHVVSVAPEVTGRIDKVYVRENQIVKPGDRLFTIDQAPFSIALESAQAAVGNAKISVSRSASDYVSKVADIGSKASDVEKAQEDFARQEELMKRGFTTHASFDAAKHALSAALADRASAAATAQAARAELVSAGQIHPLVAAAIAQRDKAALDLRRTEIRAPEGGRITQSDKLLPGNMAFTGLPSVSIVSDEDSWIEANFKETQLAKIRVGQAAKVSIDAIPGKRYRARVTGIGAGTGSQFSLLPAQNATGNWVKVTQRVPVRLRLEELPDRPLVAGWSANVTVDVTR